MRKLFVAAFMFVSIIGTKVMADIKMRIILGLHFFINCGWILLDFIKIV